MSLLGAAREQAVKPQRDAVYNARYVYGPGGGITESEFSDIKEGDYDRETGHKRCAFCRCAKPLQADGCCDEYCSRNQYAGIPVGKPYPKTARDIRGLEWLSLGT